jgi:hypothetical protein
MEFWAILSRFVNSTIFETASSGDLDGVFPSEDDARDVFAALIDAERRAGSLICPIPKGKWFKLNTLTGADIEVLDAACCMRQEDDGVTMLLVELTKITQPDKEECIARLTSDE